LRIIILEGERNLLAVEFRNYFNKEKTSGRQRNIARMRLPFLLILVFYLEGGEQKPSFLFSKYPSP